MISSMSKTKPPEVSQTSGGFCSILCKAAYTFRLLLPVVSAQPFANVIANYTCYDRNKKCNDNFLHEAHLLSAGGSTATTAYRIHK